MNPAMMQQYGQQGGYPPQAKPPQQLASQMQGLSLGGGQPSAPANDAYRRPPQYANGGPQTTVGTANQHQGPPGQLVNGPTQPSQQGYRPPNGPPQGYPGSGPPGSSPQGYNTGPPPPNAQPGFPSASRGPQQYPPGAPVAPQQQNSAGAPACAPQQHHPGSSPQQYSQGPPAPTPQHPQGYPPGSIPPQQGFPNGVQQGYGSSGPGAPPTHPGYGPPPSQQNPGFPATSPQGQPYGPPRQQQPPGAQAYGQPRGPYPGPMPPQPGALGPPGGQPNYGLQGPGTTSPYGPPQPGKPQYPQDGYQQPGYGDPPHYPQQPQASSKRIEPDQLPSVIQVMEDDEKIHSGVFHTNQKGLLPPLMTTNFVVQDGGNCSPRFMRSTLYNVPISVDILKQTAVPFSLIISPMARLKEGEYPLPVVDMGELGPVRCVRCKAYMSPLMQFVDGGRRFHCLLCKASTEVPPEYFQHLDHTGLRVDRFERPELMLGAYEFIATKDYCRKNTIPNPPAMIFVIDVSYNNVRNGLLHLICARMKEVLRSLPRMRVGFITYSSSVHFYNIKSCLAAPQMVIVGDVQEMFMPLLDGFLADPVESEAQIDLLMEEIPRQFSETRETETILLPAIQAGLEALKAAECAGKLLVFHSSLPIMEAPGKLKNRDDRKVLGGEKEKTVLAPQNRVYNDLGQDCVKEGCSVDLFVFNNSYIDLATIGQVCRLTGGEIFKYTYFQADIDGDRFIADLKNDVARETAYDAIMRVRTSTGVRATDFYGHIFMSNTTDIEMAAFDSDKAVAVEIKHDDKLTEEDGVYIQVALLYTHISGQRRLRLLNLSLKTCSQMADLYKTADLDTLINFLGKQAVTKLLEHTPKQIKESLTTRCATTLACYRKNCATPSSIGQLILPECMKLIPLYINNIMKSDAISGGSDMAVDDRTFAMHSVLIMDVSSSIVYFYPRLVPLHIGDKFTPIRCSSERLQDDGIYLLDNGIHMFLWLGAHAAPELVSQLFGVGSTAQVNPELIALPVLDNPYSESVRNLIDNTRIERHRHMRLTLVKQKEKLEMVMKHFLMEDTGLDGSPSYVDFLCHMHKEIRNLLS